METESGKNRGAKPFWLTAGPNMLVGPIGEQGAHMRIVNILVLGAALVIALDRVAQGAKYTVIDYPETSLTGALGINDSGDIVGAFNDASGAAHGLRFTKVVFTATRLSCRARERERFFSLR